MTVYKANNGKYYCRFRIHNETKHMLCHGATTKAEALAIENSEKYKLRLQQAGLIKRHENVKMSVLFKLYDKYASINKRSYESDRYFINILKLYFPPDLNSTALTMTDFENFKLKLKQDRNSSNATINKYLGILSKMYNLAIAEKLLEENPLNNIKKFSEANHKIRYLTKDEEQRLFKAVREVCPYIEPIIVCALQTGMRRSEIFNLKWSNINYDFNFIELLETKTGKSRKIPISTVLADVLEKQPKGYEYIFTNIDTGKPYRDIHRSFQGALKKANISNFRFHDLRHTVATRLVERGVALPVVKELLGHSKIETTMRYAHTIPAQKVQAINLLTD